MMATTTTVKAGGGGGANDNDGSGHIYKMRNNNDRTGKKKGWSYIGGEIMQSFMSLGMEHHNRQQGELFLIFFVFFLEGAGPLFLYCGYFLVFSTSSFFGGGGGRGQ
jgi:hypothetical protein